MAQLAASKTDALCKLRVEIELAREPRRPLAFALLIERLKAAQSAARDFESEDDFPVELQEAEDAALEELVREPCANLDELNGKLRIIFEYGMEKASEGLYVLGNDGPLARAIDAHTDQGIRS